MTTFSEKLQRKIESELYKYAADNHIMVSFIKETEKVKSDSSLLFELLVEDKNAKTNT